MWGFLKSHFLFHSETVKAYCQELDVMKQM